MQKDSIRPLLDSIFGTVLLFCAEVEVNLINVCGSSPHCGAAKWRKLETKAVGKFDKENFY
jgi:hypothetical protein